MTEPNRLTQIEQGLTDENEYFGCQMTPDQIAKAALIKLSKEAPLTDLEHFQNSVWSRTFKERKRMEEAS